MEPDESQECSSENAIFLLYSFGLFPSLRLASLLSLAGRLYGLDQGRRRGHGVAVVGHAAAAAIGDAGSKLDLKKNILTSNFTLHKKTSKASKFLCNFVFFKL